MTAGTHPGGRRRVRRRSGIRRSSSSRATTWTRPATGEAALALLERGDFDVALLDYRLPDIDGMTILQSIKPAAAADDLHDHRLRQHRHGDRRDAPGRRLLPAQAVLARRPDRRGRDAGAAQAARIEAERLRKEHEASLLALAEEKTQTHSLVSSLRDAVLVVNREGDVVLANRAMTALLGTAEDEVLRRPAGSSGEGPLASLAEQLAAPVKDRTIGQLALGERSYMASIVTFRAEDGTAWGGYSPCPTSPGPAPGHGEGALHPHDGARVQVAAGRGARAGGSGDREEPGRQAGRLPAHAAPRRDPHRQPGQLISDLLSLPRSEQAPAQEPELVDVRPRSTRPWSASASAWPPGITSRRVEAICPRCCSPPRTSSSSSPIWSATPSSTTETAAA